jgi:hypothetical protein
MDTVLWSPAAKAIARKVKPRWDVRLQLISGMKILIRAFLVALLLPVSSLAQVDDEWPSLSYLRSDYRSAYAVAHIRVREAEIVNRIGGYENWRVVCEIIEPFKGKFRKGQVVEYYHGAEAGFRKEWFYGEKLIFLLRDFEEKEKRRIYVVIENSTLPYTAARVRKLRLIKRSVLRARRSSSRTQPNNSFNQSAN